MAKPHRLFILAYEGCQLLDVAGPAAVFGAANEAIGRAFYDLRIVSPDGGPVTSNAGVTIESRKIGGQPETLLVAGGSRGLKAAMQRADLRRWLVKVTPRARRFGSVCTGAFVLAAAGLLDGKRVATHWAHCERLASQFPALSVDAESLYVVDGRVWTSAGVTTGIDMAIALVEAEYEDLELWYPKLRLAEAGAHVVVAGPQAGHAYAGKNGYPCVADAALADMSADDFDGLVVPGGFMPDKLRRDEHVLQLVRGFHAAGKLVAAICHGGWIPISARVYKGVRVTGSPGIKDDLVNAGAIWEDARPDRPQ